MNQKQKRKLKYWKIMDLLMWPVIVLALPLAIFTAWYQSAGFIYLSLGVTMMIFFISIIAGFAMNRYNENSTKRKAESGQKMTFLSFLPSMRAYVYAFVICAIFGLFAPYKWVVMLMLFIMTYSGAVLFFFKLWEKRWVKEGNSLPW